MNIKKIIGTGLAFVLAFGSLTVLPEAADIGFDTGITAYAADKETTKDGFILEKDSGGWWHITGYNGKGGDITIPDKVSYINKKAFYKNDKIKSLTVSSNANLRYIESEAFKYCLNLKKVDIGCELYSIGKEAFMWCTELKSVTFGGSVYYEKDGGEWGINEAAFKQDSKLETVIFTKADAKTIIGNNAFDDDISLRKLILPNGTKWIGKDVFTGCENLTAVTVPAITKLYERSFGYTYRSKTLNKCKESGYFKADGSSSAHMITVKDKKSIPSGYLCLDVDSPYTYMGDRHQKAITLTVTEGSPAEKWAKENKIKYKTVKAGETSSESAKTSSGGKLAAPANIKTSAASDSITLTWDKTEGADAYKVYIYNAKTKKYEAYKTVKKTTCKVEGLKSGTKYQFKVTALRKSGSKYESGESSKSVSAKTE